MESVWHITKREYFQVSKTILKVLDAFESYECEIGSSYQDNDEDF